MPHLVPASDHAAVLCTRSEQPQIMEYIKLKAQVAELQKEATDWQRKLEVAQTAAARGQSGSGYRSTSASGIRRAAAPVMKGS